MCCLMLDGLKTSICTSDKRDFFCNKEYDLYKHDKG